MGNPQMDEVARANNSACLIKKFYSSTAWIEGKAEDQLTNLETYDAISQAAAFPDLHPGKYGPVGCAIVSSKIHPHLIGNDIGCGMSLFALDISSRKLKVEKAARKLNTLEASVPDLARTLLEQANLPTDLFPYSLGNNWWR